MAQNANRAQDLTNRRRILQGMGALGAASIAGCFGDSGGDGGDGGGIDPVQDRVTVDPADIVEGGTFRTALPENIDSFDPPWSSSAASSVIHGLLYEGLTTTSATGEIHPWLAESYSQEEVNDIQPVDYEPYMQTVPVARPDEGSPFADVDSQIVVRHPDNNLQEDDEVQVLTVDDAAAAIDDGTYGMRYRFNLHEGVTFHNGEEMTASNVVASTERYRNSLLSGQMYDALLDVQEVDDYAVDIYVQIPDAAFIRNTLFMGIWPSEVTDLPDQAHDPRQGNDPIGTGPFVFEEFQDAQYIRVSKNEDYWFDTSMKDWFEGPDDFPNGPVVDEVDLAIIPDPSSQAAALRSGELDMVYGLNPQTQSEFRGSDNYRTAATDGAGFTFMQFPVTVEPFTDARVRRAINHYIPREQIANNIFDGWENPAWVPMPPVAAGTGTTDYDQLIEDLRSYNAYDPEEGDSLVEEAVNENGFETPIEVTIQTNANNDARVQTNELIVESLNQSEYFNASLDTFPDLITMIGAWYQPSYADQGNLAFVGLSGGFSPHGYAKSVHHPDNYMQCCNFNDLDFPELNEALRNARYGVDVAEDAQLRAERYDAIWELILELNGNSYGTHSTTVGVVNSNAIYGFNTYPSVQSIVGYALYSPADEQITYIDR